MQVKVEQLLARWFAQLNLPKHSSPSWYRSRLKEELGELRSARTPLLKLSEASDVFFSSARAIHDGHPTRRVPRTIASSHLLVYAYMFAKYSLRWQFYRNAASLCGVVHRSSICEVVNPNKDHKLLEVAQRHGIDPVKFYTVGFYLRKVWPLLP